MDAFRRFIENGLVHDGRGAVVAQMDDDGKPFAYGFSVGIRTVAVLDARDGTIQLEPGALEYLNEQAAIAMERPWLDDDDPDAHSHELHDEAQRVYFERGRDAQS